MPWRRQAERSELVHVVVTGHHKRKYPRKYYVFVIDVTWNNNERFEIYRRYSEFFSFQTTLKALFPDAAGRRTVERTIPQLPKRIFVGRSHVARVAEARVEQINRYCQTLVSLNLHISQSSHVIGFFSPRIGDKPLPKLHLHRPASLHPMKIPAGSLFEEYCALAEYQADDPSQVSFKSGQVLLVLDKDDTGWWMCKVNDRVGWAPPSYLKKVDKGDSTEGESDSDDDYLGLPGDVDSEREGGGTDSGLGSTGEIARDQTSSEGEKGPEIEFEEYKAIDSYEAQGAGQISFEEGDVIQVLDKIEDGWWFVTKGQEEGWVPCSYLEPLNGGQEEDNTISSLDVEHYVTIEKYTAEEEDELSFPKGVTVDVLQKSLDGWWLIKYNGKAALAPATFLVKKPSEESQAVVRKASLAEIPEEEEKGAEMQTKREGADTLTRAFYRQPPRKQSVRKRMTVKKRKQGKASGVAGSSGLKASPPTIREESPPPTASPQPRKKSLPDLRVNPGSSLSSAKHNGVARKLSDSALSTQAVNTNNLPRQRKIPLNAALSGAPRIMADGSLVHQLNKSTLGVPSENPDSDTEEHEYSNIADTEAYLSERRERKLQEMQQEKTTSPPTSDSEVESSSWTAKSSLGGSSSLSQQQQTPAGKVVRSSRGKPQEMQSRIRQWERRLSSDSEDSVSSPTTRKPIATPRASRKPDLKPKPKLLNGQNAVPPRPRTSQIVRARGKVVDGAGAEPTTHEEQQPSPPQEPKMPQRPRGTEIRRARQQGVQQFNVPPPPPTTAPSPSTTPTITATNDEGDHKVVLSSPDKSAFRPVSNQRHRSPSPGLAMVREERSGYTGTTPSALGLRSRSRSPQVRRKSPSRSPSPSVTSAGVSLAPPKPLRKDRTQSESDAQDTPTSPASSSPASSPMSGGLVGIGNEEGNPLNQQMAETLIKYVLASQDSGLKDALRDCIMSNPEAVKALKN